MRRLLFFFPVTSSRLVDLGGLILKAILTRPGQALPPPLFFSRTGSEFELGRGRFLFSRAAGAAALLDNWGTSPYSDPFFSPQPGCDQDFSFPGPAEPQPW